MISLATQICNHVFCTAYGNTWKITFFVVVKPKAFSGFRSNLSQEKMGLPWNFSTCIVHSYLRTPPTKKVETMFFEERWVTHEKWHIPFSWQMTLRLGLNEPPCAQTHKKTNTWFLNFNTVQCWFNINAKGYWILLKWTHGYYMIELSHKKLHSTLKACYTVQH